MTVWWTLVLELLTCALRFGAGLESTRDTASSVGRWTMGVRIHHAYLGLLLVLVALCLDQRWPRLSRHVVSLGLGCLFSDLLHHFVVLWLITGSPQFDLLYGTAGLVSLAAPGRKCRAACANVGQPATSQGW